MYLADIEAGKVCRVIVKDMSRAGRDYLQTGFYTEVFFRQHESQYSPFTMAEARKNVSQMLDEHEEESCSIRDRLRNHQQEQTALLKNKKDRDR